LLKFLRPKGNSIFKIHDPEGIKQLTRLRLGLSHLASHKFKHNFHNAVNSLCSCSLEVEDLEHFFLRCHYHASLRDVMIDTVRSCLLDFDDFPSSKRVHVLLYGLENVDQNINTNILKATISFIKNSQRFSENFMN